MKQKIQSIMIVGKTWFDKVNGNTYCASRVYINGELSFAAPFEYGYGSYYEQAAVAELKKRKLIKPKEYEAMWSYCNRKKIKFTSEVMKNCLKRDVKSWGEVSHAAT